MPRSDLATLFERRVVTRVYRTLAAELDAVRAGKKALAMEVWPAGELDGDPDHARMVRLAYARGLQVIHQPDASHAGPIVAVYALRPEQAWRVPTHRALWRVYPAVAGWSDAAEGFEGYLLGYTEAQIAAWLAERRHERLGWRGATIYLLLPRAHRAILEETGYRYLHPEVLADGVRAAWCDGTRRPKLRPPAWVAGAGLVLARLAIDDAALAKLFPSRRPIATATLSAGHARAINDALLSKIEVFDRRQGWTARVDVTLGPNARGAGVTTQRHASRANLAKLFEHWDPLPEWAPYPTADAEVEAIADGRKPVSWLGETLSDTVTVHPAARDGRAVTLLCGDARASRGFHPLNQYVVRLDEMWRVRALHAMWDHLFAGSDGGSDLMSDLLGYTAEQRRVYYRHRRHHRGGTAYLLVDAPARKAIERVGCRYIPADALDGATAFNVGRTTGVCARPPAWVARAGLAVARVGIVAGWRWLFDPSASRGVLRRQLTREDARVLNAHLASNVEFFGPRGWS